MADELDLSISRIADEAATDALSARAMVESILRQPERRAEFIGHAISSQNSRFRQVVARAVQRVGLTDDCRAMLLEWQNAETDEFALAAISDALTPPTSRRQPKMLKDLTDLGRTFRFIADRLRHNVLNAIPRTGLSINRLSAAIKDVEDAQLRAILDECLNDLRDSVARLEAAVSIDYEVDAFKPKDVDLVKWIRQFVRRYGSQWPTVVADVVASETARPIVTAPPYLFELIFANLFDNARHATGESTMITIVIKDHGRDILLYVLDNGPGFSDAAADAAFTVPFAASAGRQGRGLMEVNDAVTRIGGVPSIANYRGQKCVEVLLPRTSRSSEDK